MKRLGFFGLLLLMMACSYGERSDWDSGANAKSTFQEESRQQEEESTRDQFPSTEPGTEAPQPF